MANALVKCLNSETMKKRLERKHCAVNSKPKSNRVRLLSLGDAASSCSCELRYYSVSTVYSNKPKFIYICSTRFNSSLEFKDAYKFSGPHFDS